MRGPLQFAVVREDARTLLSVLASSGARRPLLVASGGCTALAVRSRVPHLEAVALDPNPAQIEHVRVKERALAAATHDLRAFNVGDAAVDGLSECGNFEALFRQWRSFLDEFVAPRAVREDLFTDAASLAAGCEALLGARCWPTSFEVFFGDALLEAVFGMAATQHAQRGSYPAHFQRAFESGLTRPDALENPFVHHLFLGRYLEREACQPEFLAGPRPTAPVALVTSDFESYADLAAHDLVDLSNVLDWMEPRAVDDLLARCASDLPRGAVLVWRQLNNARDLESRTRGAFHFDRELGARLLAADRSLFYSSLHVGRRT